MKKTIALVLGVMAFTCAGFCAGLGTGESHGIEQGYKQAMEQDLNLTCENLHFTDTFVANGAEICEDVEVGNIVITRTNGEYNLSMDLVSNRLTTYTNMGDVALQINVQHGGAYYYVNPFNCLDLN